MIQSTSVSALFARHSDQRICVGIVVDGYYFSNLTHSSITALDALEGFVRKHAAIHHRLDEGGSAIYVPADAKHFFFPDPQDALRCGLIRPDVERETQRYLRRLRSSGWNVVTTPFKRQNGVWAASKEDLELANTVAEITQPNSRMPVGTSTAATTLSDVFIITGDGDHAVTLNSRLNPHALRWCVVLRDEQRQVHASRALLSWGLDNNRVLAFDVNQKPEHFDVFPSRPATQQPVPSRYPPSGSNGSKRHVPDDDEGLVPNSSQWRTNTEQFRSPNQLSSSSSISQQLLSILPRDASLNSAGANGKIRPLTPPAATAPTLARGSARRGSDATEFVDPAILSASSVGFAPQRSAQTGGKVPPAVRGSPSENSGASLLALFSGASAGSPPTKVVTPPSCVERSAGAGLLSLISSSSSSGGTSNDATLSCAKGDFCPDGGRHARMLDIYGEDCSSDAVTRNGATARPKIIASVPSCFLVENRGKALAVSLARDRASGIKSSVPFFFKLCKFPTCPGTEECTLSAHLIRGCALARFPAVEQVVASPDASPKLVPTTPVPSHATTRVVGGVFGNGTDDDDDDVVNAAGFPILDDDDENEAPRAKAAETGTDPPAASAAAAAASADSDADATVTIELKQLALFPITIMKGESTKRIVLRNRIPLPPASTAGPAVTFIVVASNPEAYNIEPAWGRVANGGECAIELLLATDRGDAATDILDTFTLKLTLAPAPRR